MSTSNQVSSLYRTVVDDVINNVKEAFLDEGVDEQVLQELKQLWENKLMVTKTQKATSEPEIHLTNPTMSHLFHEQNTQQIQQGYVPRGAVLTTTTQQPQQSFPVSITTNQPELTGAAAQATMALPVGLFQQQFAALGAAGQGSVTLQTAGNRQFITVQNFGNQQATIAIPQQAFVHGQGTIQAQHVTGVAQNQTNLIQIDGAGDGSSSSEDEEFDNDDNDDDNEEEQNEDDGEQGEEEEPLNSADDVSEEDPTELFDSENVVVCQYDKINRNKNKWKFHLKDGIMNLNGEDFVFQRATGDAEW